MVNTTPGELKRREQALALVKSRHYLCVKCGEELWGHTVEEVGEPFAVVCATCMNSHLARFWTDGISAGLYMTFDER